jgi:hypothetical protein
LKYFSNFLLFVQIAIVFSAAPLTLKTMQRRRLGANHFSFVFVVKIYYKFLISSILVRHIALKMDLKSLDEEAKAAALKEIKNMFQRSGQLEKIDQFRHRVKISDKKIVNNL